LQDDIEGIDDQLPALIWWQRRDGRVDRINNAWLTFTGLSRDALLGDGLLVIVHDDDRDALLGLNQTSGSGSHTLEVRFKAGDGIFRWFLVNASRTGEDMLEATSRAYVALPIHDRALKEAARVHSYADLDATVLHVPTMIWRTAASGEMEYANDRYLAAWGQSFDQIKGWGWKDSIHPDDRDGIVDYWAAHVDSDEDGTYEFRAGNERTGYRWYLSTSTALRDEHGAIQKWYGATFDIEDRKQAEERLRRSEAFLRQAQLISKTGSAGFNILTGEHYWSDETYRIFELDHGVEPSFDAYLGRVHPEDRDSASRILDRFRAAEPGVDVQHRLLMPDGRVKHVRILAGPADASYEKGIYIGAIMDVTAARLAEDGVQHANAELARVMRIATMAELAASIAHEVNQPLAAILMYGKAAMRWMNRAVPDMAEAKAAAENVVNSAQRAKEVVAQLRAVFTRKDPVPVALDLNILVETTLPLLQSQLGRYNAAVSLALSADLPLVKADPVQIQQVLINLVTNGLQSPPAGQTLDRRLWIRTMSDRSGVASLCVTDDGQGIAEDKIDRLFEPFFTTKADGMGMGLSICRTIIESHGGAIAARNEDGAGATVSFTLPGAGSD